MSNEIKHTPGPWASGGPVKRESIMRATTASAVPNGLTARTWEVGAAGQEFPPAIAVVNDAGNGKANAKLIAAAPELLDACKAAIAAMQARTKAHMIAIADEASGESCAVNFPNLLDIELVAERALTAAIKKAGG